MDFIAFNHPVNPISKQRFSLMNRLTVKDFGWKLIDCIFCFQIKEFCKKVFKSIRKIELRGTKSRVDKPDILADIP